MNYYQENRNFFEPAIHWQGDKDGRTVSECPLIYFTVAQLWKVFGYHEFIFRLMNLLIVFTGLYCLFRLLYDLFSDLFWSLSVTFLLFSSPILAYYSNNFTADAPAFGLALTGTYFMWKGFSQAKKRWYYLAFLFFLLGGLIKISSLLIFIAILAIHFYAILFSKKPKSWFYKWYNLFPYLVVFFVLFLWYRFATHYNSQHVSGVFLTGIYPVWAVDLATRKSIWTTFINDLLPAYFNMKTLYLLLLLFLAQFYFYRKLNKLLLFINLLVFIGVVAYLILFYQAFTVHDYYLTNLLIFIPLPVISLVEMTKRHYPKIFNMRYLKIAFIILISLLAYKTAVLTRMKYSTTDPLVKTHFLVDKGKVDYWAWFHDDYAKHYKAFETITPYLRSHGIKRTDKVLSLSDFSFNISLYLMDQKGYTSFGFNDRSFTDKMNFYLDNNTKFLIVDSALTKKDDLKPYLNHPVGSYQNLSLFALVKDNRK